MTSKTKIKRKKRILYVSGTRADFGIILPVLKGIDFSNDFELLIYATGMHLMPEFGNTIKYIKKEFKKVKKINSIINKDDPKGLIDFASDFFKKIIQELHRVKPDCVLVLGDRVEMLMTAIACTYLGIKIAHIHGGEKTTTVDDTVRQAITKLSDIHFVATKQSALRIKQLGEKEKNIHVVGAPALDTVLNKILPSKKELFNYLKINRMQEDILLVTLHPISESWQSASNQMKKVIEAVDFFNLPVVIIYPNADPGGKQMIQVIKQKRDNNNFYIFKSLPHEYFLALERESSVWIGNSSAGMIESACFKTPVVNVGKRQEGREHGKNVINVSYNIKHIQLAIKNALTNKLFRSKLTQIKNPWGNGTASQKIISILSRTFFI